MLLMIWIIVIRCRKDIMPDVTECPCRERFKPNVRSRRLNTQFVEGERNWKFLCRECFQETYDYYADLRSSYYADVM